MSRAAKQYAAGKFDVRVPVKGSDEVAELAQAFNNMANSLATVEDQRRSFLANVSHDLRTPMTTIAGFIDGILDGTVPPEKHKFYLKIVTDEVKRLSRLVHSMLALSRIDSGQLQLNTVDLDLTALAGQTLLNFEKRIYEKNIAVTGLDDVEPLYVKGDFDLLGQVLYNLLDNAVKYCGKGGTISVYLKRKRKALLFAVSNTGKGISAEEQKHVFERFYKGDASHHSVEPTSFGKSFGLGLSIAEAIAKELGGALSCRSQDGVTTFSAIFFE
jgi:signal transduction histidine kinase